MSCYIVQEDGVSRLILEDGSGFLVLEDCIPVPPSGADINIMGDNPEYQAMYDAQQRARMARWGRAVSNRKRRDDDDDDFAFLLTEL